MKSKICIIPVLVIVSTAILGWFLISSSVSNVAKKTAFAALKDVLGKNLEKGIIVIVDFSQPSQTKRFEAINLETKKIVLYGKVAHGQNSGNAFVLKLSNDIGSLKSSGGLFEITGSFKGKHGFSLRLKGLSPNINNNAEKRGIIIHSAKYVSWKSILANWKEFFRLGKSDGCFVISEKNLKKLNSNLVLPAYLYAHHKDIKLR